MSQKELWECGDVVCSTFHFPNGRRTFGYKRHTFLHEKQHFSSSSLHSPSVIVNTITLSQTKTILRESINIQQQTHITCAWTLLCTHNVGCLHHQEFTMNNWTDYFIVNFGTGKIAHTPLQQKLKTPRVRETKAKYIG